MRYLIVTALFLSVFLPAMPVAEARAAKNPSDFEDYAAGLAAGLDDDWERVVGRAAGGETLMESSALDGMTRSRRMPRLGAVGRTAAGRSASSLGQTWSGGVGSAGFIHKGITGDFLPNVTRERSGASRGLGMNETPAARLKGWSRESFNSSTINRLGGTGSRGAMRNSPRLGTRTGSGATRRRRSASSTFGSGRTRRRR